MDTLTKTAIIIAVIIAIIPTLYYINEMFYSPYEGDIESIRAIVKEMAEEVIMLTVKHSKLQKEMSLISHCLASSSTDADTESGQNNITSMRQLRLEDYDRHMVDFALESAGARIIDTGETIEHVLHDSHVSRVLYTISSILCRGCDGARTMLQPGSLPGECWAFKGSHGEGVIQLLGKINVTGVAIEHIPAKISPTGDISSAPRHFQLEGLDDTNSGLSHNFGKFEYDRYGQSIQRFNVVWPTTERYFSTVRVRFLSNWGHPEYTCVYRVRVHGRLAPGQT